MTRTKRIIISMFGLLALCLSHTAYSEECCCEASDECGFYFGAQLGYVQTHWSNIDQNAFALSEIIVKRDDGYGVRAFIGYEWNEYVAFELGGTYLNRATFDRWTALDFFNVPLTHIQNWAYDASLRLSLPIWDNAGLFTRVGLSYLVSNDSIKWRANSLQDVKAEPFHHNPSTYNVTFGFGAYYELTCNLRAEISWMRFGGNTETTDNYQPSPDFFSFGLSYRL